MGGWSCDWWEAQWQLSCTLTEISYGRQKDKEDRKGLVTGEEKGAIERK